MTALDELHTKVDLFKRLAAEHAIDVRIEDPVAVAEIPDCPPGLTAVFRLFSRVEGTCFRCRVPDEILSRQAWDGMPAFAHRPVERCGALRVRRW